MPSASPQKQPQTDTDIDTVPLSLSLTHTLSHTHTHTYTHTLPLARSLSYTHTHTPNEQNPVNVTTKYPFHADIKLIHYHLAIQCWTLDYISTNTRISWSFYSYIPSDFGLIGRSLINLLMITVSPPSRPHLSLCESLKPPPAPPPPPPPPPPPHTPPDLVGVRT